MSDLCERILWSAERYWDRPCFGVRASSTEFKWKSFSDVFKECLALSFWLQKSIPADDAGEKGEKRTVPGPFVAICSGNRPEWIAVDISCVMCGAVSVGMHSSWLPEDAHGVLIDTNVSVLFCDGATLPFWLTVCQGCPRLKHIVCFDSTEVASPPAEQTLHNFKDIISDLPLECQSGSALRDIVHRDIHPFQTNDGLYAVVYSSGTSGALKGVPVSQKKWFRDSTAGSAVLLRVPEEDRAVLSYSPLAHGMDRGCVWMALFSGGRAGFVKNSEFEALLQDIHVVRPVLFTAMPHFWNRLLKLYKERIFAYCTELVEGIARSDADKSVLKALVDTLISSAASATEGLPYEIEQRALTLCREMMGGKLIAVGTGGAVTSPDVLNFMRKCLPNAQVVDSYGTTEVPGISSNGVISQDVEVKLADVPELGYTKDDKPNPRGEVLCRTPDMTCHYWGTTEAAVKATRDCYDEEGWYHTGDVGEIDQDGKLHIIDRRNNLGELYVHGKSVWIPLSPLETLFTAECPHVQHIFLHADRTESVMLAVVDVADVDGKRCTLTPFEILTEIRTAAHKHGLSALQTPRSVVIASEHWSPETGEVTSTMKVRRAPVAKRYRTQLAAEYARLEEVGQRREANAARAKNPDYDFAKEFSFVCDHAEDESSLQELFYVVRDAALKLREVLPVASARAKEEEEKQRQSLQIYYSDAMSKCEKLVGNKDLIRVLSSVKQDIATRYSEISRTQSSSDAVVDALRKAYHDGAEKLVEHARFCCENVPFQISAGLMIVPPEAARARNGNCLAEGLGLDSWRVLCNACGIQIEWGSDGSGTPRWVCLDCSKPEGVFYCERCYAMMKQLHEKKLPIKDFFSPGSTCVDDGHILVLEKTHLIWMRDAIIAGSPSLTDFVKRIFKDQYSCRPCVKAGDNWLSYNDVWKLALVVSDLIHQAFVNSNSDSSGSYVTVRGDVSIPVALITEVACILGGVNVRISNDPSVKLLSLTASKPITSHLFELSSELEFMAYVTPITKGEKDKGDFKPLSSEATITPSVSPDTEDQHLDSASFIQQAKKTVHFEQHVLSLSSLSSTYLSDREVHASCWSALLCGLRIV